MWWLLALAAPAAPTAPAPAGTLSAPAVAAAPAVARWSRDEAARAIAAGRFDQARAMILAAIGAGAAGPLVDRLQADLALARRADDEALARYSALLVAAPDDPLLLERAGLAALRLGHDEAARALVERATRQPGASAVAWRLRGVAADRRGDFAEAGRCYAEARSRAPEDAAVYADWGWSLALQRRWGEAQAMLRAALARRADAPRVAAKLALVELALDPELPVRRAGEDEASYADRLDLAGTLAAADGNRARARAAFAQALSVRATWDQTAAASLAALDGAGR